MREVGILIMTIPMVATSITTTAMAGMWTMITPTAAMWTTTMDGPLTTAPTTLTTTRATGEETVYSPDDDANDPAQMRAALDQAQKPLAEMKDHTTMCMNMMSMMQNMHGSMSSSHMGGE